MYIFYLLRSLLLAGLLCSCMGVSAQVKPANDTTSKKKKRLITKLMKSISRNGEPTEPVKTVNPFLRYSGRIIRSITIVPLGFDRNLYDTSIQRKNFPTDVANAFHLNSSTDLIRKNLFFKEGDKVLPLLLADNERFLREQEFLQDAFIRVGKVDSTKTIPDSIDVVVFTKDVFSLGVSGSLSRVDKARLEIREENFAGWGDKFFLGMLYDGKRQPNIGYGGEVLKRNIRGSFVNWAAGFTTFSPEITSQFQEENRFYTIIERPLVSRYKEWTGRLELSLNQTANNYWADSPAIYKSRYSYSYVQMDLWGGYNFGAKDRKTKDSNKRLRHFVGIRGFYNDFNRVPAIYKDSFDYKYANINGSLLSYTLYKQNFYRTNFIYGFGRNEDVPEGISASIIGGYTNKQGVKRSYYGLDFAATHFSARGHFTNYTFRYGGFINKKTLEDVDLLFGIDHFTRLRQISPTWRNRNFISVSYTKQLKLKLNEPLFISSVFGLPYYRNGEIFADTRATVKLESVFYNLAKIAGFRVAPFIFSDVSFLKPIKASFDQTKGYSAFGGGFRTRNENLIFGTIELRGYIFPSPIAGMRNWKIDLSTNLRFKYNSSFIKRPDFVVAN
jgi:hypothetical protein